MKLTLIAVESGKTGCPTLFKAEDDTYVVQGWRVDDDEALATMRELGLPDHETAVQVPKGLLDQYVRTLPQDQLDALRDGQ
ncbi:hypothetical protein PV646_34135 [Streptomyces sp. ID05-26A]|nr:hypothetical protein [Streptomyces sp. ID05-26A]